MSDEPWLDPEKWAITETEHKRIDGFISFENIPAGRKPMKTEDLFAEIMQEINSRITEAEDKAKVHSGIGYIREHNAFVNEGNALKNLKWELNRRFPAGSLNEGQPSEESRPETA